MSPSNHIYQSSARANSPLSLTVGIPMHLGYLIVFSLKAFLLSDDNDQYVDDPANQSSILTPPGPGGYMPYPG